MPHNNVTFRAWNSGKCYYSGRPIAVSGAGTPGHWGEVCQSQSEMDKGTREELAPEQAAS